VRDVLCEDKITDLAGAVASHVQIFFGDEAAIHPLCTVGKGWERERKRWLASEARWVLESATSYDARGNAVSTTADGVTRTMSYDATGLFPTSEQVSLGGGPGGGTLTWTVAWDQVLGLATELTDPSGQRTRARYDALGRTIGYALNGQPDHLVIAYDWTSAYPKTTIFEFDGAPAALGALPGSWTPAGKWRQTVEVSNGKGETRYRAQRLDTASWIISDYRERDPAGRVVFTGQPVLSAQLELAARPAGIVGQTLGYDPLGRLLEQRLPNGASRTYTYASFERTVREDAQAQVRHVLDGKGRIIATERALPGGGLQKVEARYDAAGRLTQMILQGGAVTRDFTYDTLGRLTSARDPDLGLHVVRYDDAGRVLEERNGVSQTVTYTYDVAGRILTRDSGQLYRYHYDAPRPGTTLPPGAGNLAGRLAWVEEPTGAVELGYDAAGRATWARRQIDGHTAEETTAYAASGLVLGRSFDDGLALSYGYDPAGRIVSVRDAVGELWRVAAQDAAGRILEERFKNGAVSRFGRDALGLVSRVEVKAAGGESLYDVAVQRNLWSGITAVTDSDGAGLDHTATFGYDELTRLTSATVGSPGAGQYSFSYAYDGLQNMTARTAVGPTALGVLPGAYRYAENGAGPRQLTSILGAGGQVHTFGYDAAGRQIAKDGLTLSFDALDQLQQVAGLPGGAQVTHAYGYDGLRVKTTSPQGVGYWFSETLSQRGDVREHDIVVGDRVVARVAYRVTAPLALAPAGAAGAPGLAGAALGALGAALPLVPLVPLGGGLALIAWALLGGGRGARRRGRWTRLGAAFTATALVTGSCSMGGGGSGGAGEATRVSSLAWALHSEVYFHVGIGAGPTLFTDAAGRLLEERRYEPFGEEIDARLQQGSGYAVGAPDLVARDLNSLNKRSEATTGWSYHGARWMAPETGRWLTGDPPLKTPSTSQLRSPWGLHPYQYVDQNPVRYWDPDGHDKKVLLYVGMGEHATHEAAALTKQVGSRGTVISVTPDDGTSSVFTEGGTSYDLSSDNEQFAFAQAVAPAAKGWLGQARRNIQAMHLAAILKNADEDTRDEIAAVISAYSRAERGEINLERVVISGHHYEDDDEIWGDGGASMKLSDLGQLARIFPAAAGGVRDMGFSACNTLVDEGDLDVVKSMFPALDTAWGYKDTCPGTWTGAIEHLKNWEKATRGQSSWLTGREASGIRKGGNVRVENFQ
jgi:RHS repeat-associated protein